MTVGTYTALGFRWTRVGGSALAHLVPRYPGRLATTVCRRIRINDLLLETPRGLLSELEKCHACQTRNGTAGPAGDWRIRGYGPVSMAIQSPALGPVDGASASGGGGRVADSPGAPIPAPGQDRAADARIADGRRARAAAAPPMRSSSARTGTPAPATPVAGVS